MIMQSDIVLLIDDNEENKNTLRSILHDNYTIIEVSTIAEARNKLENCSNKITVIILNLLVDNMSGFMFLSELDKHGISAKIPVIVTLEERNDEKELQAFQLGAYDIIVKPFRPTIILKRLENTIKLLKTSEVINLVERDTLTGLYNSNFFFEKANQKLQNNPNESMITIFINIVKFKLVNELFSRSEGDRLLQYVGNCILGTFGDEILCSRIGGDYFSVLLPEKEYSEEYLYTIIDKVNQYELPINIVLKFGIYIIEDNTMPMSKICDRAKLAIDGFNENYDSYINYYDDSIREKLLREQMITNAMKAALTERQFVVFYQPKFDLATESVIGAEALVRWNHPTCGFLSPGEFIPIFEKNGFVSQVDYYVWDCVCQKLASWIKTNHVMIPISVNVSRVDLYNPKLPQLLYDLVNKYDIPLQYLHLEITETAYTDNTKQMVELVNQIRKIGFVIEMDDFGAGYSSLNMLSDLPIEVLKLDMRFLRNNVSKTSGRSVIHFIITLAKWLGLFVVAEGVESQEQAVFLKNMGCDFAQGFYYSKPIPDVDFEKLLLETHVSVGK